MSTPIYYITSASDLPDAQTYKGRLARAGGWWAVFLTVLMIGSVAEAIMAAGWSEGLQAVRLAMMAAAFVGLTLALTRWQAPFAIFYGAVASLVAVTLGLTRVLLPDLALLDGIREVAVRNGAWIAALIAGTANADNLVFVTQLAFLSWWLAFFAVWSVFRHQSVAYAAIPLVAALIVNLYFSPFDLWIYLVVFLISTLLLAVRVELARNESVWQFTRIRYAPDISLDFWKGGLVFAVAVLGLAWLMPDLDNSLTLERLWRPFQQPWRQVTDTWARMYESVSYPSNTSAPAAFGRNMPLGGPVDLSDRPIFEAEVSSPTYWRAAVYDNYTGRNWRNTDEEVRVVERNQPLGEPGFFLYHEITSTLHPLESRQETIFSPPQPVRVSVPVDADATALDEQGAQYSVSRMNSRIPFEPGDSYRVVSAVTLAPADSLRKASTDYPQWVRDRFLQLPESLPQRVRDRALGLAAGHDNVFDIAAAIEADLRQIPYNQDIPAPPAGADAVDYFLYDIQQGYCDYYASAMVTMLRAVGIPARMAAGYTGGSFVPATPGAAPPLGVYRVLERNAHAWPEVYFPNYGWIQFEPTASEPLITRPEALPNLPPAGTPTPPIGDDTESLRDLRDQRDPDNLGIVGANEPTVVRWFRSNWQAVAVALALLAVGIAGWLLYRRREAAFYRQSDLVVRLFGVLGLWAARLHVRWPDSYTPLERVDAFGTKVPDAGPALTRLASLFAAQRYGRQEPGSDDLAATTEDWRQLQPVFWKKWASEMVDGLASIGRRR